MQGQKRLSFDTSGVNALADDPNGAALLAGIRSGYFTRLTFPSIEEPVATSDEARRYRLFDILNTLRLNGECLLAHNDLATKLIQNYEEYHDSRWASQDIRFVACETALARRELSEVDSDEQRKSAVETNSQFAHIFADPRPKFEELFVAGTERPTSADQLLARLNGSGGAFWNIAAGLYERVACHRPTEEHVRGFTDDCPPFFALMLGLVHAQYEWTVAEKQVNKGKRVNRIDLFSAIYLPYCDVYITNDVQQGRCLTEIAATAKLPVEILTLASFSKRLMPFAHISVGA